MDSKQCRTPEKQFQQNLIEISTQKNASTSPKPSKDMSSPTEPQIKKKYYYVPANQRQKTAVQFGYNSKPTTWQPEEQRKLFELQDSMGNNWTKIGKILNKPQNAVKSKFHVKIRRCLNRVNSFIKKHKKIKYLPINRQIIPKLLSNARSRFRQNQVSQQNREIAKKLKNQLFGIDDFPNYGGLSPQEKQKMLKLVKDLTEFNKWTKRPRKNKVNPNYMYLLTYDKKIFKKRQTDYIFQQLKIPRQPKDQNSQAVDFQSQMNSLSQQRFQQAKSQQMEEKVPQQIKNQQSILNNLKQEENLFQRPIPTSYNFCTCDIPKSMLHFYTLSALNMTPFQFYSLYEQNNDMNQISYVLKKEYHEMVCNCPEQH